MKKTNYSLILVAFATILTISCSKTNSFSNEGLNQNNITTSARSNSNEGGSEFTSFEELLDYYDALYKEGDYIKVKAKGKNVLLFGEGNEIALEKPIITYNKHDIESTSKLSFAKDCNDYILTGGSLKVGYNKDTKKYWADKIPC